MPPCEWELCKQGFPAMTGASTDRLEFSIRYFKGLDQICEVSPVQTR